MVKRAYISLPILCAWVGMLLTSMSNAQVSLQRVELAERMMSARTFFQATFNNPGASMAASLEGEVRSAKGDVVLSFHSATFQVPSGITLMGAERIDVSSFAPGSGEAGRSIHQFQRLPDGRYDYCVRLRSSGGELQDEFCDRLEVEEFLYLDLVTPWDNDTIEELRPALSWTVSGTPAVTTNADVRLVLVPDPDGKNSSAAIASERPLFILPHVKDRTVAYPFGMPDLEQGKCYAWQVERMDGARVIDRSEPWRFCIARHDPLPANKYAWLGRGGTAPIYEVTDDRIYFRYDEPYASQRMACSIKGAGLERIAPEVKAEGVEEAAGGRLELGTSAVRTVGVNLYELDLNTYALSPGIYELLIKDEKQREYAVKFRIGN